MKPIQFHPGGADEFDEAVEYYDRQKSGLGAEYRAEVETALARLLKSPASFSRFRDTEARKCLVKRFPYSIFFVEFEEFIWVVAVAHQKRREGYWMNRLSDIP